MAEQIRAEEGAIEKGATAVDNARSGIENRIKDIEAKMAELGSGVVTRPCRSTRGCPVGRRRPRP